MANEYLEGLPRAGARSWRIVVGTWVPLVVAVFVVSRIATGQPELGELALLVLSLSGALALALWGREARRSHAALGRELPGIERLFLRGEDAAAVAAARALILRAPPAFHRARALVVLGQVAEHRGEMAAAAEVYEEAALALPRRRGPLGMAFAQLAPVIGVRRAFCLAAAGRLDEAQRVLDGARDRDELPGVRALAVRAQALLHAHRGEHQQLVELASREHVRIKNGLAHRDRALLRVLLAWGRSCVGGAFRAPPPPGLDGDSELRAWIARVLPDSARPLVAP